MVNSISVADAKKHLSELMSRVAYHKERFLIGRRSEPIATLVSADDLARLEPQPKTTQGLLAALGACSDFDGWDQMIEEIYRQREQSQDRTIPLDE